MDKVVGLKCLRCSAPYSRDHFAEDCPACRSIAPSNLVVAARWILQPVIFDFLRRIPPDVRGELSLTDAVRALRQSGGSLWATPLRPGEARRDIGNFESFFTAFVRAALRDEEFGEAVVHAVLEELGDRSP